MNASSKSRHSFVRLLRLLWHLPYKKLDVTAAAAYDWPADLSDEQILEKLLALNLERAGEEEKSARVKKPKLSSHAPNKRTS